MPIKTFREPARELPIARDVDVIVVGGGPAGLAAAIAAARNGASTVLIERFGYLGGTATASLMACINGFRNQVEPDFTQTVRGIAEEIVLELKALGLPAEKTTDLSRELCALIHQALSIPTERIYIEFGDVARGMWGWNGGVF